MHDGVRDFRIQPSRSPVVSVPAIDLQIGSPSEWHGFEFVSGEGLELDSVRPVIQRGPT